MSQYTFSSNDEKLWKRKLHGSEIVMANASETLDGWGLFGIGVDLALSAPVDSKDLKTCVSSAWTRLRHSLPAIAAWSTREDHGCVFEYRVPDGAGDLREWLDQTIIWHDDQLTLADRHTQSKLRAWNVSQGHYSNELHVSTTGSDVVQILIHGSHWSVDARYLFSMMDMYLRLLKEEILSEGPSLGTLRWGEESVRLPPAAAVASGILGQEFPAPPHFPRMFIRPCKEVEGKISAPDYTARATLTVEESDAFRKACKSHGKTATQVLASVLALSELQIALWLAENQPRKYAEATELYKTAEAIPVALTVNARDKLQREYTSLVTTHATPGMVVDSIPPIMLDMNIVRNALEITTGGVSFRDSDSDVFWDEIVPAFVSTWNAIPVDAASYVSREEFFNAHPEALTFEKPLIVCSSVGDIDRLGWIGKDAYRSAFTVETLNSSVRFSSPLTGLLAWQWGGKMELRLASGAKTAEEAVLHRQLEFFIELVKSICAN